MWFFYALFFAFVTSFGLPLVKRVSQTISPLVILFLTNLFTIPFLILYLYVNGGIPQASGAFYTFIIFAGILDLAASLATYFALKISAVSLVSPIGSFNPVFTMLFAAFILRQIPSLIQMLGILTVVVGTYVLHISDIKHGLLKPLEKTFSDKGVQLFFLANFLWGLTPILQRQAVLATQPNSPAFAALIEFIFNTLVILPFVLGKNNNLSGTLRTYGKWFVIIGIFTAGSFIASFTAVLQANLGAVTAVFKLSTLFTILWGALFFKEERIREKLLGASIMILGTILLIL